MLAVQGQVASSLLMRALVLCCVLAMQSQDRRPQARLQALCSTIAVQGQHAKGAQVRSQVLCCVFTAQGQEARCPQARSQACRSLRAVFRSVLAMQGRDARCLLARLQVQHSAHAVPGQDAVQLRPWSRWVPDDGGQVAVVTPPVLKGDCWLR